MAQLLAVARWDRPTEHLAQHIRTLMPGSVDDFETAAPEGTS